MPIRRSSLGLATIVPVGGPAGVPGTPGGAGPKGDEGRGVDSGFIDTNNHLIFTLSDGATLDAGAVSSGGASGVDSGTAAVAIGGHKVVRAFGGQLYSASSANPDHLGTVIGVSLAAAAAGAPLTYKVEGLIIEPSWSFAPGPVYLGADGSLTQALPTAGFLQQIGVVQAPTQVSVQIQPPILIG